MASVNLQGSRALNRRLGRCPEGYRSDTQSSQQSKSGKSLWSARVCVATDGIYAHARRLRTTRGLLKPCRDVESEDLPHLGAKYVISGGKCTSGFIQHKPPHLPLLIKKLTNMKIVAVASRIFFYKRPHRHRRMFQHQGHGVFTLRWRHPALNQAAPLPPVAAVRPCAG